MAQTMLGTIYCLGLDLNKDLIKAAEFFQRVADQKYPDAQCSLAEMYEKGEGVEQNIAKAKELYQQAANQGSLKAKKRLKEPF